MKRVFAIAFGLISLTCCADDVEVFAAHSVLPNGKHVGASDAVAIVLVNEQRMVFRLGTTNRSFKVSTAIAGIGSKAGSDQTPPGWHRVHSRYGGRAAIGQVLKARRIVPGEIVPEAEWGSGDGDKVLSRLLWLEGLEVGVNRSRNGDIDSFLRHIYIHGTNQEQKLGTPASHGCIRMGNRDIVELFEITKSVKNFYIYISK